MSTPKPDRFGEYPFARMAPGDGFLVAISQTFDAKGTAAMARLERAIVRRCATHPTETYTVETVIDPEHVRPVFIDCRRVA